MNRKTFGNKWLLAHRSSGTANAQMSAPTGGRYVRTRLARNLERLVLAEYVSSRARGLALESSNAVPPISSPAQLQQIALSTWEDEGGKVKLHTPRTLG